MRFIVPPFVHSFIYLQCNCDELVNASYALLLAYRRRPTDRQSLIEILIKMSEKIEYQLDFMRVRLVTCTISNEHFFLFVRIVVECNLHRKGNNRHRNL